MGFIPRFFLISLLFVFNVISFNATAHEAHTVHQMDDLAVSLALDLQGHLWRASVNNGYVIVDKSTDMGKSFSSPVKVNANEMKITAKGEARPKIAIAGEHVYLTWTESLAKPFAGYIWFARSIDGGQHFESPYIVHQDRAEITHRFDALNVAPNGVITVAWVDKRDLIAAKKRGIPYNGAAIYYAVSNNQGKSFAPEVKLADSSCECCRIALTNQEDGKVVAMWRHVFAGSERDHAIAEIGSHHPPTIVRASFGHWKIDGCPHHGGALAYGKGFGYHMAYFDGAGNQPTLKYARMDGQAWVSSPPKKFGHLDKNAGHPAIQSIGDYVWLVWQEGTAKLTEIWYMQSDDGGKTWGQSAMLASIEGKSDYPHLLTYQENVYLAVNTLNNGLVIKKVHTK